jgi:hypothetical protein
MSEEQKQRDIFLNYVVRTMVAAVKFRRAFINILQEVDIDSVNLMGNELEKAKYFSLVGDGKKVLASENKMRALKSHLIDLQQVCLLHMEAPKSLTGLHNATARILSKLTNAADGFHSFFGNPLHEFYGFVYLKRGWNNLEVFEAEYSIIREVLKDLLDPISYRENFENIENISIL